MFQQNSLKTIRIQLFLILSMLCFPLQSWAGPIQIESGKMVLLHKSNQVEFTKDVHLIRDEFELFSDRLVAYYNDKDLERAEAFGNIKLKQGEVTGSADKAVLNQKSNTLTLIGHALLEQHGNRLEGNKIIHDISLEKTQVFPVKGGRTHMTIESSDDGNAMLPSAQPSNKQHAVDAKK
ncbi:MAG: lipopolysaccharide transport periplasmic protein LptA [Mariprofundus sp.]|nr:lipopolysaccharide transport periplasmic protein LptA [Mariprofundus sp.]